MAFYLELDVRLQCRTADQKSSAARGRPQKGAVLKLKLRALPLSSSSSSHPVDTYSSATLVPSGDLTSPGPSRSTTLDSSLTDDSQFGLHLDETTPLLAEDVGLPVGSTGMGWPSEKSLEGEYSTRLLMSRSSLSSTMMTMMIAVTRFPFHRLRSSTNVSSQMMSPTPQPLRINHLFHHLQNKRYDDDGV